MSHDCIIPRPVTLYSLHLSKPVKGFGKPSVRAVPAVLSGHWREAETDIVCADRDAIRAALPHQYRAAFDRAGVWYPKGDGGESREAAYATLRDTRGRYMNTVYAIPYAFSVNVPAPALA